MKRIVPDTNVLVLALINSFRAPGRVLDLVLAGKLAVAYDDRILAEWRDILRRGKFGFAPSDVGVLLGFVEHEGTKVNPPVLDVQLPDPDDAPFLEVAVAADAILITGNLKHYPPEARGGVKVMDPKTFLEQWTSETS